MCIATISEEVTQCEPTKGRWRAGLLAGLRDGGAFGRI